MLSCVLFIYSFLQKLINNINRKQHLTLIGLCLFTYVFFGTMPFVFVTMNYVSWFMVLFFIGSYIRLYPLENYDKKSLCVGVTLFFIVIGCVSVIICNKIHFHPYYFLSDSNNFLLLAIAFSSFIFVNNSKMKYNKFINTIASTTFGILCIHANSDTTRQWLWNDTVNTVELYQSVHPILYAIISVIIVFSVCSLIELIRIKLVEERLMNKVEVLENKLTKRNIMNH